MRNIVLLYFACRNHKPGLLSSFMTYPRIFKMNNTTWTISETGTSYPSTAQEKQSTWLHPRFLIWHSVLIRLLCITVIKCYGKYHYDRRFKLWWSSISLMSTKLIMTSHLTSLNMNTDHNIWFRNLSLGLGRSQTCGGVQPANGVQQWNRRVLSSIFLVYES